MFRQAAYGAAAQEAAQSGLAANLTELDDVALQAWKAWAVDRDPASGRGGFPWRAIANEHTARPDAFHAAIWSSEELCGLVVGEPQETRRNRYGALTVLYVEGSPRRGQPLKGRIRGIAFTAAQIYAAALGARVLRVDQPVNAAVAAAYEAVGFHIVGRPGETVYYAERRITR